MVFRTAPISIPARVVSGGHRKIRLPQGRRFRTAGPSACRKSLFASLSKFSELYKSSENLGFQWRRTPFLGFPRTPFLTVAENLPLYRQSPYIASAQKSAAPAGRDSVFCISERPIRLGQGGAFSAYLFCTKLKNLPLFFLLQLLQKMKCGQKSC